MLKNCCAVKLDKRNTARRWVDNDWIVIFGWRVPLTHCTSLARCLRHYESTPKLNMRNSWCSKRTLTQCTAQLCRKEPDLFLPKPALQQPVRVQVSEAAVVTHCREDEMHRYFLGLSNRATELTQANMSLKYNMRTEKKKQLFAHHVDGERKEEGMRLSPVRNTHASVFSS